MSKAKPHGKVDIEWIDNVLIVRCHGPYNAEGIGLYIDRAKAAVAKRQLDQWYRIDILDDETLGSPEVIKLIGEFYIWSMQNKCLASVIVCSNVIQEQLVQAFIDKTGANMITSRLYDDAVAHINTQVSNHQAG